LIRDVVVLQNCMDLLNGIPCSDSETCDDGSLVIDIKDVKAEDVTDVQEEDPVPETVPGIKAEQEVCLCVHC
jgi:hypothetical protein